MTDSEGGIAEETVEMNFHFLPAERQAEVDEVIRALQEDGRLEFMLGVLEIRINDRRLSPSTSASGALLRKLLQALDQEDGAMLLYTSPYNQLGQSGRSDEEPRIEWWDFELGDRLVRFEDLRSVRAFLEHGTGSSYGRPREEARRLHDRLLHGLAGDSTGYAIWGCSNIQTPGENRMGVSPSAGIWPAEDVSPWFHGVFWDDLIFILNPAESTLVVLAITSS